MKLQIDTKEKTIKIDENVKIDELIKVLKKLLPKDWDSYTLEANVMMTWSTYPVYPFTLREPWVIGEPFYTTCASGIEKVDCRIETIYNIEVN